MKKYLILALLYPLITYGTQIEHYADRIFINDNPALIVSWTPKAACTTILTELCKAYNLEERLYQYPNVHHFFWKEYYFNHIVTTEKFFNEKYYKVKFVRCPYKRAVSGYLQQIKKNEGKFTFTFEEYLLLLKNKTWEQFNIHSDLQHSIELHSKQQYTPFDSYMHIIKIEAPDEELEKLYFNTGIKINLDKINLNSTSYDNTEKEKPEYVGNLIPNYMEPLPTYFTFYSKETLSLVEEIYEKDINFFNYECPQEINDFILSQSSKNKCSI